MHIEKTFTNEELNKFVGLNISNDSMLVRGTLLLVNNRTWMIIDTGWETVTLRKGYFDEDEAQVTMELLTERAEYFTV